MWFNNPQILKIISQSLFWGIVIIPALLAISKFAIDKRIEGIKENVLNGITEQLNLEKLTIKSFSSTVKVIFSGEWTKKPYPNAIVSPVNHQYYLELQNEDSTKYIKFYATKPYTFNKIDDTSAVFESHQAVNDGNFPLGNTLNELSSLNAIQIHVPFVLYKNFIENKVVFNCIEIKFFINGTERHSIVINSPSELLVIQNYYKNIGWANALIKIDNETMKMLLTNK